MFFPVGLYPKKVIPPKVASLNRTKMVEQFNMIQYCIDNSIPCFSFAMDATKRTSVKWGDITPTTFTKYINPIHNVTAIVTGYTHFVIDFDEKKHHPPEEIKQMLIERCSAIEETPGGFHFWFKIDERTEHIESGSNIKWANHEIIGLDIRAKKGICYVAPSRFKK